MQPSRPGTFAPARRVECLAMPRNVGFYQARSLVDVSEVRSLNDLGDIQEPGSATCPGRRRRMPALLFVNHAIPYETTFGSSDPCRRFRGNAMILEVGLLRNPISSTPATAPASAAHPPHRAASPSHECPSRSDAATWESLLPVRRTRSGSSPWPSSSDGR
jgi:hypothetical protein